MRRAAVVTFAAALSVAWASAGARPFIETLVGAPAPIDFARDYVSAHAHVHGVVLANEPAANDYAASIGAPRVVLLDGPYYMHPPPAVLFVLPLVQLGFGGAALVWLVLGLAALGALAHALVGLATRGEETPAGASAATFLLLALWPPMQHDLAKGQWSIFLAALVATGWRALEGGRPRAAGVWIGLAASLKATPILLLGYLLLRQRRAAAAMTVTLAATALASLALFGPGPWRDFFVNARPNLLAWQTWTANTASLNGLIARLFAGGAFARPLIAAPALAQALTAGATLLLVALLLAATHRAPAAPASEDRRLFAAWTAAVVVANPLAWTHTAIIGLIALVLLRGVAPRWALAAVVVTLTVPRETLAALAGPLPVQPGRGLALSLHAVALLSLVGLGLRRSRVALEPGPAGSPAPP